MKTITFYVVAFVCLIATKLSAQETFEGRVKAVANNIEQIKKEEKDSLKTEVEAVNLLLENNEITSEEADKRKLEMANKRAANIESRVAVEEDKLAEIVKDKVDGKIKSDHSGYINIRFPDKNEDYEDDEDGENGKDGKDGEENCSSHSYRRTTSHFTYALGINRIVVDGEINNDGFEWRSDFYEIGLTANTRIFKNNNLLHARYGFSLQYNNLRPDNNMYFVKQGNQTVLQEYQEDDNLKVSRFRYVNFVIPLHLEFDFTPKKVNGDKTYFPDQESFRIGIGGYAGFNFKEKQTLKYRDENDHKVFYKDKGDYNTNDFVYGLSAYVGYDYVSIYAKYDLQPIFENNDVDWNNFSLGIRFDL